MKKLTKRLLATAIAGVLCFSTSALVACGNNNGGEGKSAYEIAVENGFEGTEQEWLDSLKTTVTVTVTDTDVAYDTDENGVTTVTVTNTMSDGTTSVKTTTLPKRIVDAQLSYDNFVWSAAEATNKSNIAGAIWQVTYDDGSISVLPANKSQIVGFDLVADYHGGERQEWDGTFTDGFVYRVTFYFGLNWIQTVDRYVYVCNDLTTLENYKSDEVSLQNHASVFEVNDTFDVGVLYLKQNYSGNYNEDDDTYYSLSDKIQQTYQAAGMEYYGESSFGRFTAVTQSMLDKTIDTSTAGDKDFTVTYGQKKYQSGITVYDPSVTIVSGLSFYGDVPYQFSLTVGDDIAEESSVFVGKKADVYYYKYVNGNTSEKITITSSMIDTSEVDMTKPGHYNVKLSYKGYVREIPVIVNPDMSAATLTKTITGSAATIMDFMGMEVNKVDLYDNNYAVAYAEDEPLTENIGLLPYTLTGDTLVIEYFGEKLAIAKVDGNTFTPYEFTESQLVKTYTGSINMGGHGDPEMPITLKTYNNGFAELIITMGEGPGQSMTYVLGYTLKGTEILIAPSESGLSFSIGENDTVTMNMPH